MITLQSEITTVRDPMQGWPCQPQCYNLLTHKCCNQCLSERYWHVRGNVKFPIKMYLYSNLRKSLYFWTFWTFGFSCIHSRGAHGAAFLLHSLQLTYSLYSVYIAYIQLIYSLHSLYTAHTALIYSLQPIYSLQIQLCSLHRAYIKPAYSLYTACT